MSINQASVGLEQGVTLEALAVLQTTESYMFYLTGSRYFGGNKPHSDWDFFVDNESFVHTVLTEAGFTRTEGMETYPDDGSIVEVLELGNVQVQLVQDAAVKWKAQTLLLHSPMYKDVRTKKGYEVRPYWTWALHMARTLIDLENAIAEND